MSPRLRSLAAIVLAVVGAVTLFLGAIYAWAVPTLLDSEKFAARARAALDDSASLRRVVARELVVNVIEPNQANLIAFRPLLVAAADVVVGSAAFGDVFEIAVRKGHEFFTEEPADSVVARANEALLLLIDTVRLVAPDVADQIPVDLEPALLRLDHASAELELWRAAERARSLAVVLPVIGVVSWAGAVLLARDRRRALVRVGVALTVGGVVILAGLRIGERLVGRAFETPLAEQAARDVWNTFVEGLRGLAWFGIVGGIVVAAAVQAITREESRLDPARLRAAITASVSREPASRLGRVALGAGGVALGLVMFASPLDVVETGVTVLGAFVFYAALVYVLDLLVLPAADAAPSPQGRTWALGVAGSLGVLLVAGLVTYLLLITPESTERVQGCNGRVEYCLRRLDEIALPTAHNAPTAAEDGFLLANHERGVAAQLQDGIRGFQIDAYLGSRRAKGRTSVVFTDLDDNKLLTIENTVGPELTAQALEFRRIVGPPPDRSRRDVYLCHNFCELGALRMRDTLEVFRRFLERNPAEVLVFVIQDELPAEELLPVFRDAGLDRYLATVDPRRPLPRLGEMVASGRRLVVGLEHGDLGPRMPNVFRGGLVQEVPYTYRTVDELLAPDSCRPLRGRPDAPLFQFNHWVTPASLRDARVANSAEVLGERLRRCREERGRFPNLVAVDFYDEGDLFAVVDALNASPGSRA